MERPHRSHVRFLAFMVPYLLIVCTLVAPQANLYAQERSSDAGTDKGAKAPVNRGGAILGKDYPEAETIRFVSSLGSRVTGYPGYEQTAVYIEGKFKEIGLAKVGVSESFKVVIPFDKGASMLLKGPALEQGTGNETRVKLACVWPNLSRTSKLPLSGIEGNIIYAGGGFLHEFNGKEIMGSIVLMDFNCSARWINAAMLGAKAVIFIEPRQPFRSEAQEKFLAIPASIPRFWISKRDLLSLVRTIFGGEGPITSESLYEKLWLLGKGKDAQVKLLADMEWQEKTAKNIIGTIFGSDPQLRNEIIYIEAYYDSMSAVPSVAPGAGSACGIASLMEIAKYFVNNPPRRTVRFLATAGHFQALSGIRYFTKAQIARDAKEAEARKKEAELATSEEELEEAKKRLYIALDLSSGQGETGIFYKGHFYDEYGAGQNEVGMQREFSDLAGKIFEYEDKIHESGGWEANDETFGSSSPERRRLTRLASGVVPRRGRDWRSLLPSPLALDSEVLTLSGRPAIAFVTINDARDVVDTPLDTYDRVDFQNLHSQTRHIMALLKYVLNDSKMVMTVKLEDQFGDAFAKVIEENLISYLPSTPIDHALITFSLNRNKSITGVRGTAYHFSDKNGLFEVQGLSKLATATAYAFTFTPDGIIDYAPRGSSENVSGAVALVGKKAVRNADWTKRRTDARLGIFPSVSTMIYDLFDQVSLYSLSSISILEAESNSAPEKFSCFVGRSSGSHSKPCGVIFTEEGVAFKITMSMGSGLLGKKLILLGTEAEEEGDDATKREVRPKRMEEAEGVGYCPEKRENAIYGTSFRVAKDMWNWDNHNIKKLKATGVSNKRVDGLHRVAGELIEKAGKYEKERKYDRFYSVARAAWGYELRAYPNIRGTSNDVIKGVIFYFAILFPFVIFAERLFLGLADIRKRLVAIAVIFGIVYVILSYIHPAFQLSHTPVIILIGFFMFTLAIMVVFLILNKFNLYMENLRQKASMLHRSDVARASAAATAFMLGISNMRRRKTRTTLTCITLILLTFSVISLTSFETSVKFNKVRISEDEPPYEGILLRRQDWSPLEEYAYYSLLNQFREHGGKIALRTWYTSPKTDQYLQLDVKNADNPARSYIASGLVGLDPVENELLHITDPYLQCGEWFEKPANGQSEKVGTRQESEIRNPKPQTPNSKSEIRNPKSQIPNSKFQIRNPKSDYPFVCILPRRMADGLGITAENLESAKIKVLGSVLKVIGIIDSGGTELAKTSQKVESGRAVEVRAKVSEDADLQPGFVRFNDGLHREDAEIVQITQSGNEKLLTIKRLRYDYRAHTMIESLGLKERHDLDEEPITPVDYIEMQHQREEKDKILSLTEEEGEVTEDAEGLRPQLYLHQEPDTVLYVPNDLAVKLGASLRSVAVYLKDKSPEEIKGILEGCVDRLNLILFAGIKDAAGGGTGTYLYSSRAALTIKGLKSLIVPIFIAALIVFNTMLGSVYERIKEIAIYASVGLAPVHISALFFAESCVYGIIGTIVGYLVGQCVAKAVTFNELLLGLNLNYSSTAAVWTAIIVLFVVLLSTIYPARKAAQLAVPDETRKMRFPSPEGDDWNFTFPFTVGSAETIGMNAFLLDYFRSHDEDTIGRFYASGARLWSFVNNGGDSGTGPPAPPLAATESSSDTTSTSGDAGQTSKGEELCFALESNVWVAPLDAGISQTVRIETIPAPDDERLYTMKFNIHRTSGEPDTWRRINPGFLKDVRKQLLIWRLVAPQEKERLTNEGKKMLGII